MQKYKKALRMHHSPLWFDIISMAFHLKMVVSLTLRLFTVV